MRRPILHAAIVLMLAVASAACGSDGNEASDGPSASGLAATATGALQPGAAPAAAATQAAAPPPGAARGAPAAPPAAQAQPIAVDPCRVVTKEELEAALGIPLSDGQRGTSVGDECRYKSPRDPNPGTMPTVIVAVFRSRLARTTYDGLRESASASTTDVPGLGEKAYVHIGGGLSDFRELQALQGDVLFSINLTANINPPVTMSPEEKRMKLIALARTALGRL